MTKRTIKHAEQHPRWFCRRQMLPLLLLLIHKQVIGNPKVQFNFRYAIVVPDI
ncbi:MAG: hypothetical protein WBC22_11190 [Sedimentisphaerales bacterium]